MLSPPACSRIESSGVCYVGGRGREPRKQLRVLTALARRLEEELSVMEQRERAERKVGAQPVPVVTRCR